MNILAVTVPIYIVMAIGYLAGRAGAFSAADMRVLGKFVVKFALPRAPFHRAAAVLWMMTTWL